MTFHIKAAMQAPAPVPEWVEIMAEKHGGYGLKHIMTKVMEQSDLNRNQNRLLIHREAVRTNLIPALTLKERKGSNLAGVGPKAKKSIIAPMPKENLAAAAPLALKKAAGRSHGGVSVSVYIRNGWRFCMRLTQWDGSGSTVLKGHEWKSVCSFAGLRCGDIVRLWMFRRDHPAAEGGANGKTELCFVLG